MAVQEQIYQRQVGPGSTANMPGGNPEAEGAAIGAAAERLGGVLHENAIGKYTRERKVQANEEAANFNAQFARLREQADAWAIESRNSAEAGAKGHAEAAGKWLEENSAALTQGITEQSLLDDAKRQIGEFGARFRSSELNFEAGTRVAKLTADTQTASDIAANRARRALDPKSFAEEIQFGRDNIEALDVPAAVRVKLIQEHEQKVAVSYLNGLNDSNPMAAIALIDGGAFDEMLDPAQVEQARNGATIEIRRAEAAAAHQAELAKAQAREDVQAIRARVSGGVAVDDGEIAKAQAQLEAMGDTGGATELGILRVQNGVRRETEPWTPAQFEREIATLQGKAKRSEAEDVRLKALRTLQPAAVSAFNNAPGDWAARNGLPPPALNLSDPGSIAARIRWSRAVQTQTGRPVDPLLPAEAAQLRLQAEQSPAGRAAVADQISALGGYAAFRAARQIAPNDPMLGRLAQLAEPDLRRAAMRGGDIRKARTDLIDGVNGRDAQDDFYESLGSAASLMDPGDVKAAFEVARNLYASSADDVNYDGEAFKRAASQALGARTGPNGEQLGGLGTFGRKSVILPDGMSDRSFDKATARIGGIQFRDGPLAPVWAGGEKMSGADVIKRFTPVRRPDGTYEFHNDRGEKITVKDGRTWTFDFARFAREQGL